MNPRHRRPTRRVDGVLLLDKPPGMTSNAALQCVKRLYQAAKAGHTGSLDPLAEGMLPICLGEATKLSGFLLNADKTYRFRCRLGVTTTTGDAEGEVLERHAVPVLQPERIDAVLRAFLGEIEQLPPMYSAVRHQGRRLYELARQGREVERRPRRVTIHDLRCLDFAHDRLECETRCSKGTYIRTLAEDIGRALGCGAHVEWLRRTAVAPYGDRPMVTLSALEDRAQQGPTALDGWLLPVDSSLPDWPSVHVDATSAYYLTTGQPVQVPRAPVSGRVKLYQLPLRQLPQRFLGIGEILDDGRVAPRRMLQSATVG